MKKLLLPVLCAMCLAGASACTNNTTDSSDQSATVATDGATAATATTTDNDTAASAAATPPADTTTTAPHKDDPEFMKSAAHSDQNEIQLSKLVLAKGVTGMVKDHANLMIKDHTKSTADLMPIAKKKGVTLPTDMDAEHKAIAEQLQGLSGQALEQKYLQQMVLDHQKTLNTMKAHSRMTKDADLKGFIAKVTPVVQSHLQMFQQHSGM